jgi:sortase A
MVDQVPELIVEPAPGPHPWRHPATPSAAIEACPVTDVEEPVAHVWRRAVVAAVVAGMLSYAFVLFFGHGAQQRLIAMVEEGIAESTLRHAAGHIPSTALPGRIGNVGVAAHRDRLFHKLRGIRKRDRIVLSTLTRDYDYEVTSISIVNPDDVSVLAPSPGQKTLTLVTCYPFSFIGDAPERFIVRARQIHERTLTARR